MTKVIPNQVENKLSSIKHLDQATALQEDQAPKMKVEATIEAFTPNRTDDHLFKIALRWAIGIINTLIYII